LSWNIIKTIIRSGMKKNCCAKNVFEPRKLKFVVLGNANGEKLFFFESFHNFERPLF
jgi:hypothetical protein